MYNVEFTIREPRISWFNKILFSALFSGFCVFVLYIFKSNGVYHRLNKEDTEKVIVFLILLLGILIAFILPIIARHYIHLNFTHLKIRHSYSIGPLVYREKWQNLKDLNYISVFHTKNGYEVNLWYKKHEILNLFVLDDFNEVLEKGFFFSEKLNIDLLDARKRGHHKRINKVIYKETGKVEYLD
ncbi:hypothetical protein Q4Q34_06050 [Flavivirga abyssicola]|uniref:hypothetical protein n=1 Tax=Flavivirga abyssicola TaxID=3063533 RepID=UPI0026E06D29|nr:hypothetical protein [Flavivirga sp. MEBiC07777]WVK14590.1 hypothetical protein Q4Q34_06050 [Flavivirga sp. MEBiC07777]